MRFSQIRPRCRALHIQLHTRRSQL